MCGLNVVEGEPEVEDEDALFREMFMGDDAVRMLEKERVGEEVFQRSEDEAEDEEIMRASDEEEFFSFFTKKPNSCNMTMTSSSYYSC